MTLGGRIGDRAPCHLESMILGCLRAVRSMWGRADGMNRTTVRASRARPRRVRRREVADVYRVEGSPKKAHAGAAADRRQRTSSSRIGVQLFDRDVGVARFGDVGPRRFDQRRHASSGDGGDREERQTELARPVPRVAPPASGSSSASILLADTSSACRAVRPRRARARAEACRSPPPDRVPRRPRHRPGESAPWFARRGGGTDVQARGPVCAPSIRPGTSATTKLRSSLSVTTPRFGVSVVNG